MTPTSKRPKRAYQWHTLPTVKEARELYPDHTRKELAALLGLTDNQLRGLLRRERITKTTPRGSKQHQLVPAQAIVKNNEIQYRAAA